MGILKRKWRWNRDSNPGKLSLHTLSKRADSAALAFHQTYFEVPAEPDTSSGRSSFASLNIYFEVPAEPVASYQIKRLRRSATRRHTVREAEGCFVPDLT